MIASWMPRLVRPHWADLGAAISAALVLIPQSLAYAVLAGMPPATGLAVGAVATIAAAPFVSSPYLQTGPVAITGLLTFGAISALVGVGSDAYIGLAALLAVLVGVVRLGVGMAGIGTVAYVMSRPVLGGFVPAAGLVIAVSQIPDMVGVEYSGRGPLTAVSAVVDIRTWDASTLGLAVLTIVVLQLGRRVHTLFPAVLVAVVAGVIAADAIGFDGAMVGPLPAGLPHLDLALPWDRTPELISPALVVALVGFAEPAAIARTYAQQTGSIWDADREFVSQGVANVAAGLFGGFPAGGSFSRSAVARQAGARTAWTGLLTGVIVLIALPFAPGLRLPSAVLGGIIFSSVLSLLVPSEALGLRHRTRQQFGIAVTTYAVTVVAAPQVHIGVLVGIGLSIAAHLRREARLALPAWRDGGVLHVQPTGVLFFGSAHRLEDGLRELLSDQLGEHREVSRLVMHMDRLGRVDVTGALVLRDVLDRLERRGIRADVVDLTPTSRKIVSRTLGGT